MRTVVTRTCVSLCVGGLAVSQDLPLEMRADNTSWKANAPWKQKT